MALASELRDSVGIGAGSQIEVVGFQTSPTALGCLRDTEETLSALVCAAEP